MRRGRQHSRNFGNAIASGGKGMSMFAYAPDGTVLLNPATPSREGKSYPGEKDKKGKLFHDALVETAKTKGSGWIDYWLPKPGATEPSQKWSYVKAVKADGIALVGAGFYPD